LLDGEAVVLAGDFDSAGVEVFDGLVAAAVAEFQFKSFSADGAAEELVAEADAEDGDFAEDALEWSDGVVEGGGVAGAVGDEEAVGAMVHDFFGGDVGREDGYFDAALAEVAED